MALWTPRRPIAGDFEQSGHRRFRRFFRLGGIFAAHQEDAGAPVRCPLGVRCVSCERRSWPVVVAAMRRARCTGRETLGAARGPATWSPVQTERPDLLRMDSKP